MAEFQAPAAADEAAPDPGAMNLIELLRLARQAVATARAHDLLALDTLQVTVEEMMAWVTERLAALSPEERISAEPLFAEQTGSARWVALFLALLELAKAGLVHLDQQGLFTPIFLTRTARP
jgi:chromatin segregation and condensation protein Rec8/ScpA/Scc1 (kleisin family)